MERTSTIGIIVTILVCCIAMFAYFVIYPPIFGSKELCIYSPKCGGLMARMLSTYVATIVYAKMHGCNNVLIDVADVANDYTTEDGTITSTYLDLPQGKSKDRCFSNNLFTYLHGLLFDHSYSHAALWGMRPSHFPIQTVVPLHTIHQYIQPALRFRQHLHNRAENILSVCKGRRLVGVHFRGGDTIHHYPYIKQNPSWFETEVRSVWQRGDVFIVVSIDKEFREYCKKNWNDIPYFFSGDVTLDSSNVEWESWKQTEQTSVQRGEDVIVDCLVLSKCNYIIKNRSCISDLAILLNPDTGCSFIMKDKEVYRKEVGATSFGPKGTL